MKTETRIKKQYDSEPEEVKEYMHDLIDQLVRDYGVIDPSWTVSLDMICDWYNVYVKARNDIKETGVSFLSSRGDYRPHPSFSAMNTASSQIQKLLSTFAASPYQKSKMKSLDRQGGKIFDESEYVQGILSN